MLEVASGHWGKNLAGSTLLCRQSPESGGQLQMDLYPVVLGLSQVNANYPAMNLQFT